MSGELLLTGGRHHAARRQRFRRREVERRTREFPETGHMFLSDAFSELAAARDRMLLLGLKSAPERVASLLLLSRRQPAGINDPEDKITISAILVDVADYFGLSPETVRSCLRTFWRAGIIGASQS